MRCSPARRSPEHPSIDIPQYQPGNTKLFEGVHLFQVSPDSFPIDYDHTVALQSSRQAARGTNHLTNRLVELLLGLLGRFALDLGKNASVLSLGDEVNVAFDAAQVLFFAPFLSTADLHT
jgi:hypothetical protein